MTRDFREFLEQASRIVATWPKWKREVLVTWDLGDDNMSEALQERLSIRIAETDRSMGVAALKDLLNLADRQVHLKEASEHGT